MEEAQARDPGNVVVSDAGWSGHARAEPAARFDVRCTDYSDVHAVLGDPGRLLGMVAFGRQPGFALSSRPFAWVDMPVLGGDGFCEVWQSDDPVELVESHGVRGARTPSVLFGALQIPEAHGLELAARVAYDRVFSAIDALGYPHLLRAWNYLPAINADVDGMERYRRFNIGRHDAFAARGRTSAADMPAACALGCRAGPLTVYFIAGVEPGSPVENPRQVSAYRYPTQYGPRTPTFSRAMLMPRSRRPALAISGTASIVGHETQHVGNVAAQVEETLTNIGALLESAGYASEASASAGAGLLLKAYLRREQDFAVVQRALSRSFGAARVAYLNAEICRAELLVEIEGVYCP